MLLAHVIDSARFSAMAGAAERLVPFGFLDFRVDVHPYGVRVLRKDFFVSSLQTKGLRVFGAASRCYSKGYLYIIENTYIYAWEMMRAT
ncbi:MAG: hypothetical protein WA634_04080 [Silvibacterium sp.]